jgi:hypothetical protein
VTRNDAVNLLLFERFVEPAMNSGSTVRKGLLLNRLGNDPAYGSRPLATVIQDLASIVSYFAISTAIIGYWPAPRVTWPQPGPVLSDAMPTRKPPVGMSSRGPQSFRCPIRPLSLSPVLPGSGGIRTRSTRPLR